MLFYIRILNSFYIFSSSFLVFLLSLYILVFTSLWILLMSFNLKMCGNSFALSACLCVNVRYFVFLYEFSFCLNMWTLSAYSIKMYVTMNNGYTYITYLLVCHSNIIYVHIFLLGDCVEEVNSGKFGFIVATALLHQQTTKKTKLKTKT